VQPPFFECRAPDGGLFRRGGDAPSGNFTIMTGISGCLRRLRRIAWLAPAMVGLYGCALPDPALPVERSRPYAARPAPRATPGVAPAPAPPAPATPKTSAAEPDLQPGVAVRVTVLVDGKPEIEVDSRYVSDTGDIDLPMIKKVHVAGLTLNQVAAYLSQEYRYYFLDPEVVVAFAHAGGEGAVSPWGYVTVMGRVNKPGSIAIPASRDLTVSKAILQAGGLAPSARDRAVRVTRRLPDGRQRILPVDLRAFVEGGKTSEDIVLQDGDVVFVPETLF
jgi:protein involved in polysaccharide export with SLBB domain